MIIKLMDWMESREQGTQLLGPETFPFSQTSSPTLEKPQNYSRLAQDALALSKHGSSKIEEEDAFLLYDPSFSETKTLAG